MYSGGRGLIPIYLDDDEPVPELIEWAVMDIDHKEVAKVYWNPPAIFPWWLINEVPLIKQVKDAVRSTVGLQVVPTYSEDVYQIIGDEIPLFEVHKISTKKNPTGYCFKCDERGVFVRTALLCPSCNAFLGGF